MEEGSLNRKVAERARAAWARALPGREAKLRRPRRPSRPDGGPSTATSGVGDLPVSAGGLRAQAYPGQIWLTTQLEKVSRHRHQGDKLPRARYPSRVRYVAECEMAERSKDWMAQAHRDLESARWTAEGGFHKWACFVAQQGAEKAVKAIYSKLGGAAFGHSVAALLTGLRERVDVSEEIISAGRMLDRFYIPTRYPNGWESGSPYDYFTKDDSDDAIGRADDILRFCKGLLAG